VSNFQQASIDNSLRKIPLSAMIDSVHPENGGAPADLKKLCWKYCAIICIVKINRKAKLEIEELQLRDSPSIDYKEFSYDFRPK
jgi:hypothetical protein